MSPRSPSVCRLVVVVLGALLLVAPLSNAVADDGVQPAPAAGSRTAPPWTIPITQETTLGKLLEQVLAVTGLPLVYDPENKVVKSERISCELTLRGGPEDLVAQLRQLLYPFSLTLIRQGGGTATTYHVFDIRAGHSSLQLRAEYVEITRANIDAIEAQVGRFVTTWIPLRHVKDLRNARAALQRLVSQGNLGNVTEVPQASGVVVTDFAPMVASLWRIVQQMDAEAEATAVRASNTVVVPLRHARAAAVAAQLVAHFGLMPPSDQDARGRQTQGEPASASSLRITADTRTNQLLVSGSADELDAVRSAAALLDFALPTKPVEAAPKAETISVVRLTLRHASAQEAAGMLMNLYSRHTAGRKAHMPRIVPEQRTGSLLIAADEEAMAAIREMIALIDQPAPAEAK
ncbi:MAG: secretin N-terminal domain-containing protein [Planctomycetota bacterium]